MNKLNRMMLATSATLAVMAGTAAAADSNSVYPSELLDQKPALQAQYDKLVQPIASEHGWVESIGTETPVTQITVENTEYAVLSSCKPHDCNAQGLVVLMTPNADTAVGALVVNEGESFLSDSSTITWLGQPDESQRQFMAAYLFR